MVKQTAIQELLQEFEQLKKTKLYEKSFKAIDDCILLALAKLPKEEQQIIDAIRYTEIDIRGYYNDGDAEFYYKEEFKKQ